MHVDGHLSNILASNKSGVLNFVWNDFGRSTTKTEHTYGDRTIKALQSFAHDAILIKNFTRDTLSVLTDLQLLNYETIDDFTPHACVILDVNCVTKSLEVAREFVLFQVPRVSRRLVAGLLNHRVDSLEDRVAELRKDNLTQSAELKELRADNATQSKQIDKQFEQITNLSAQILELRAVNTTQSAQITNLYAQITELSDQFTRLSELFNREMANRCNNTKSDDEF
jgi:methyl-accepting chemotaxis protein